MSVIAWSVVGMLVGILLFALLPVAFAHAGGHRARDTVGGWYVSMAMRALGDVAIVARKQNGISLATASFDPKFGGDKVTVDDVVGHVRDELGVKSRMKNKPFGICLESHDQYISPLFAEFAERFSQAKDDGDIGVRADGGAKLDIGIPRKSGLPGLRDAYRIIPGNCKRRWATVSESWTKKSQEGFHNRFNFGQTMSIIIAFAAGAGLGWFVMSYGGNVAGGAGGNVTDVSVTTLFLLAIPMLGGSGDGDNDGWIATETKRRLRMAAVGVISLALVALLVVTITLFYGMLAAVAFLFMAVIFAGLPWALVWLLGSGVPGCGAIGRGLWLLAQVSAGRGAIVRTDTGHYEWHPLQEEEDDEFFAELDNGDRVPIDGDDGDLFRFGWRPLAITEQKTDRNMEQYEPAHDDTIEDRQGYTIDAPDDADDGWRVTAAKVKNRVRGAAGAQSVRNGRTKALEEEGGTKQVGPVGTILAACTMLIVGFGLVVGTMVMVG